MVELDDIIQKYSSDIDSMNQWIDKKYNSMFSDVFNTVKSIKSDLSHISDDSLEYVLTELPIDLMIISETLSMIRSEMSVIKLKQSEIRYNYYQSLSSEYPDMAKTEVNMLVDIKVSEYKVIIAAYENLIKRVDSDILLAKELIMGCKKVWDSRRLAEKPAVSEVIIDPYSKTYQNLPDYTDIYSKTIRRPDV